MASKSPILTLNNGVEMPALGFGVFLAGKDETVDSVKLAIGEGYSLIDTASGYENEAEVGRGLRESGAARDSIFITTKLTPTNYGYDQALAAFDVSMDLLGLDILDLYLLHWPVPAAFDTTVAAWKACEHLLAEGRTRAIGVSNFTPAHLDALIERSEVVPAVNQIELHPYLVQSDHDFAHRQLGIVTQAWSPIGGIKRYWGDGAKGSDPLSHPVLADLAAKYGKSPAQIALRWHLDIGHSAIPKSVNLQRIRENIDVFDFTLITEDIAAISSLDTGQRGGPDPETCYTPGTF